MRIKQLLPLVLLVPYFFFFCACDTFDETSNQITLSLKTLDSRHQDLPLVDSFLDWPRAVSVGQNTSSSLNYLQYYIREVGICGSMRPEATTFSENSGCVILYTAAENSNYAFSTSGDYSGLANTAQFDSTHFQDVVAPMSINTNSRASLRGGQSFSWGYISWFPPVKLKGHVTLNGGNVLKTRSGIAYKSGIGSSGYYTIRPNSLLTDSFTEEAIFILNQHSQWFRLQTPFTLSDADVTAGTPLRVHLFLNATGALKGFGSHLGSAPHIQDISGNSLRLSGLHPVATMGAENLSTVRESYRISSASGEAFDIRLDLYYKHADSSRSIMGVDALTLYNGSSSVVVPEFPTIASVTTSGSEYNFLGYNGQTVLSQMARLSAVGSSGTLTLNCHGGLFETPSCYPGATARLSYTLESITKVD